MDKIEKRVAKEILQQPENIKVGGKIYKFYPPSTATLILASEAISKFPKLKLDTEDVISQSLSVAKDCRAMGEVIAILLLGAKHLTEKVKISKIVEKKILGLIPVKKEVEEETIIDKKEELARQVLEDLTPHELQLLTLQLLSRMEIKDFFALTTFLAEVNLLKATKVDETTASGQ